MAVPDNRIRFDPTKIDFTNDVGETGQTHDNFPAPSTQARYDWMRSFLIGLLSCQSSESEPTQYRNGSFWFDLTINALKIRANDAWVSVADAIALTDPDSDNVVVTLASWYASVQDILVGFAPEIVFSGQCTVDGITTFQVPASLQSHLAADSRVFLYINGTLVKPTNIQLIGTPATTVRLSGLSLSNGDSFTAIIKRIPSATFYSSDVVVP